MNFVVGIEMLQLFFSSNLYHCYIKLNQFSYFIQCRKRTIDFIQVTHNSRAACIIEMATQKTVHCSFDFILQWQGGFNPFGHFDLLCGL